ncbi:hypothetical protein LCL95_09005 [Bacillus timonensis]|nr:hypothetical protein [Bacillus timonensis]
MNQSTFGFLLFLFLLIPPVASFMESIMVIHMHMQMPMLVIAGVLIGPFFQTRFPHFFRKWNENGVPGSLLFLIIIVYWTIPRTMDEALTVQSVEIFKFISLPFLAGIPLRDSWGKLSRKWKNAVILFFTVKSILMGWLYIYSNEQLCNNYLLIEQLTLGWSFIVTAIALIVYLGYQFVVDHEKYEMK